MPLDHPAGAQAGQSQSGPSQSSEALLDAQLRGLAPIALDRRVEVQTLRRARAVLVADVESPVFRTLRAVWERAIAPTLVLGAVAGYLAWAVQTTSALYH